jgi:hypothetical protein
MLARSQIELLDGEGMQVWQFLFIAMWNRTTVEDVLADSFQQGPGCSDGPFWVFNPAIQGLLPCIPNMVAIHFRQNLLDWSKAWVEFCFFKLV